MIWLIEITGPPIEKFACLYKECLAACCKQGQKLTPKDAAAIIKATGKALESFTEPGGERFLHLKGRGDGKCIFLNKDCTCALHKLKAKPLLCELFPFQFKEIVYSDDTVVRFEPASKTICPGYRKGEKLSKNFYHDIEKKGLDFVRDFERTVKMRNEGKTLRQIVDSLL